MADKVKKLKQWLPTVLKLAVAGGLIYWLESSGKLDFSIFLKVAHPTYVVMGFLALFINLYLNNYRWVVLMRAQGFDLGVKQTLPLTFIGLFFNFAMPGGVGGDLVKGYYIMQENPGRRTDAATSVLMDRIVGFVGMVVMSLIAVMINFEAIRARSELTSLAIGVFLLFCAFFLFFTLAFSKTIYSHPLVNRVFSMLPAEKMIRKIYVAVHSYNKSLGLFWYACGLTVLSQFIMLFFFVAIGAAYDLESVSFVNYAFVIPLGLISTVVPIAPAGIGVGQTVFLVLFTWALGHHTLIGPTLITAHQLASFILGLAGAYFYFRRKRPASFEEAAV